MWGRRAAVSLGRRINDGTEESSTGALFDGIRDNAHDPREGADGAARELPFGVTVGATFAFDLHA
jgi:hypothetical protein